MKNKKSKDYADYYDKVLDRELEAGKPAMDAIVIAHKETSFKFKVKNPLKS